MLSPLFWLVFLLTFVAVKALADAGLALPLPTRRRRPAAGEPASASESEVSLRPAA